MTNLISVFNNAKQHLNKFINPSNKDGLIKAFKPWVYNTWSKLDEEVNSYEDFLKSKTGNKKGKFANKSNELIDETLDLVLLDFLIEQSKNELMAYLNTQAANLPAPYLNNPTELYNYIFQNDISEFSDPELFTAHDNLVFNSLLKTDVYSDYIGKDNKFSSLKIESFMS